MITISQCLFNISTYIGITYKNIITLFIHNELKYSIPFFKCEKNNIKQFLKIIIIRISFPVVFKMSKIIKKKKLKFN